jgi:hypothetical protein
MRLVAGICALGRLLIQITELQENPLFNCIDIVLLPLFSKIIENGVSFLAASGRARDLEIEVLDQFSHLVTEH